MTAFFQYPFGPYRILQIPVLTDNYIYLICDDDQQVFVVDPALAKPVQQVLEKERLKLTAIINTHHHWDHVDGNKELITKWNCPVFASQEDQHRIPGITQSLCDGDIIELGPFTVEILFIPGHTLGHIAYYFKEQKWLFSGDTIFSLGCGRLFEGSPQQMHSSLNKLRQLPEDTTIFCTHEYTKHNLNFSYSVMPDDEALKQSELRINDLLAQKKPTVPMSLGQEKKSNLFLRWDDVKLRQSLSMNESEDWQVFAEVRSRRDNY